MRAVRYSAPRRFEIADLPDPHPGPGEVRVAMTIAGCCGTDVHIHEGGFFSRYPLTPGHEIVGEIDELGAGVHDLRRGQRVAVDNTVLCGTCRACRRDEPLFCRNFHSLGVTDDGGFAEYVVASAAKCFPVDDLSPEQAVVVEPLACAVHGMDVLALRPGSDVCVLGAGPTGLLLTQLLVHGGAARVTVAAPSASKLERARALGADETVLVQRGAFAQGQAALAALAPEGFDAVIEATGATDVLAGCPALSADGGTILVYGMAGNEEQVALRPYEIFKRQLTLKGSFAQTHCFDRAIAYLRSGRVRVDGLVTHRFALDRYGDALEALQHDRSCVKAAIVL
jgi:D-arabinitol dehydrogenase (NADP+)